MNEHVVRLGDCIEGMAALPDKSVDVVLTDPPYNQRTSQGARRTRNAQPLTQAGARERFIEFDGIQPADVVPHFFRLARRWVVAFCALEQLGSYEEVAGEAWIRAGVWARENGAPQFTGDRPAQGAEGIAIMHAAGRKHWNGGGKRAYWIGPVEKAGDEIGHPTPKPLWLMDDLVRLFTDPGELILDPFAGSGTTGVACKRLGRRFLGFERDPKYHAIAERRIRDAREQAQMFVAPQPRAKQGGLPGMD